MRKSQRRMHLPPYPVTPPPPYEFMSVFFYRCNILHPVTNSILEFTTGIFGKQRALFWKLPQATWKLPPITNFTVVSVNWKIIFYFPMKVLFIFLKSFANHLLQLFYDHRHFFQICKCNQKVLQKNQPMDGFLFNRNSFTYFYRENKKPYLKIFNNIDFLPVKIEIHMWKNSWMCPWKILTVHERCKFVYVKAIFCACKNSRKALENFPHTFSRRKNKTAHNIHET